MKISDGPIIYPLNKSFIFLRKEDGHAIISNGYFNGETDRDKTKLEDKDIKLWFYKRSKTHEDKIDGIIEEKILLKEIESVANKKHGESEDNLPPFVFLTPIYINRQVLFKDILITNEAKDVVIWTINKKKYAFVSAKFFNAYPIKNFERESSEEIENYSEFEDYTYIDLSKFGDKDIACGFSFSKTNYERTSTDEENKEEWLNNINGISGQIKDAEEEIRVSEEDITRITKDIADGVIDEEVGAGQIGTLRSQIDSLQADIIELEEALEDLKELDPDKFLPQYVFAPQDFFIKELDSVAFEDRVTLILNGKTNLIWRLIKFDGDVPYILPRNKTEEEIEREE